MRNEEKISKALRLLIEKDVTNYRIWRDTGISQGTLHNYKNGKTKPSPANADILINYFEGEKGDGKKAYLITPSGVKYFELPNGKFRMRVPFIPIKAYAKYVDECRDVEFVESLEEADFIVDKIGHGKYFSFEIKGDSMDDGSIKSIPHGSTVLARDLSPDHWCTGNGLRTKEYPYWIIVLDNTILCKEIIDQDVEKGKIMCHSLNPSREYNSDFEVNINEIRQLLNIVQKTLPAI